MPWKVAAVSEIRLALVHSVRTLNRPLAVVAREFGVRRKTANKWLAVADAQLIRLGIRSLHGRPYHPQTQGKVERFHGPAEREMLRFNVRRDSQANFIADVHAWRHTYNHLRPHEALGDQPPVSRWRPSDRKRPAQLPEPASFYPAGSRLRRVDEVGTIRDQNNRILLGRGIAGQQVRVEESDDQILVYFCRHPVRSLWPRQLTGDKTL